MNGNLCTTGPARRGPRPFRPAFALAVGLTLVCAVPRAACAEDRGAQPVAANEKAPETDQCDTGNGIVGIWQSPGLRISIIRAGCVIAASFWGGTTVYHEMVGYRTGEGYDVQVTRTADNCTVIFKGRLYDIGPSTMKGAVDSTSGDCGFATDWTEKRNYIRVK